MSSRDHRPDTLRTVKRRKSSPPPTEFQHFSKHVDNPDRYSPKAMKAYVPPEIVERIDAVPPQYMRLSEKQFRTQFQVDETDGRLRLRFWDLFDRATNTSEPMDLAEIYAGVCSQDHFWDRVLGNPVKMAWMMLPPTDPELAMREVFYRGLDRFRDILSLPIVTKTPVMEKGMVVRDKESGEIVYIKEPDRVAIGEIRKIVEWLSDRYSAPRSKKAQATIASDGRVLPPTQDFDSMEAEILEMEKRLKNGEVK